MPCMKDSSLNANEFATFSTVLEQLGWSRRNIQRSFNAFLKRLFMVYPPGSVPFYLFFFYASIIRFVVS